MNYLTLFLTKIQTFSLHIITKSELKSLIKEDGNKPAYSLAHETYYYDSFTFKSEIRVLKDMALIDLLSLNDISLKREQAAEFLSLSVPTLYTKVSRKEIPVNKRGKRLYFSMVELSEWVRSGRKKTVEAYIFTTFMEYGILISCTVSVC